jgi:hypothetical protein
MRFARLSAIAALVFLAPGAMLGGVTLIANAHGAPFGFLPQSLLQHSPFHSYLYPGIILLVANGLPAMWALWLVFRRLPGGGLWTTFQGCVLLGWLSVECWLLRMVMWAQIMYALVALVLIISGLMLWRHPVRTPAHG